MKIPYCPLFSNPSVHRRPAMALVHSLTVVVSVTMLLKLLIFLQLMIVVVQLLRNITNVLANSLTHNNDITCFIEFKM